MIRMQKPAPLTISATCFALALMAGPAQAASISGSNVSLGTTSGADLTALGTLDWVILSEDPHDDNGFSFIIDSSVSTAPDPVTGTLTTINEKAGGNRDLRPRLQHLPRRSTPGQ